MPQKRDLIHSSIAKFGRVYNWTVSVIGSILMIVIVVTMGTQVFFRYVLNDSLIWAEELSSYMLVLISFLLLGAAFQRGEMMNLEIVTSQMPPRFRAMWNVPLQLGMICFLAVLSYYCYKFALLNKTSTIPALDFIISSIVGETRTVVVSRFWLYMTLPLGLMIFAFHLLISTFADFLLAFGITSPEDNRSHESTMGKS